MGFSEWSTIINTSVGIIGIIVGIIGWKSLSSATNIKNSIKGLNNSTIQQAQTITVNNGLDTYAVIKLSQETTQEELTEIVKRINDAETKLSTVEKKIDSQPKIHTGATPPTESKDGDIWFQT
ncbi:MAG: hypothetical protein ABFD08_09020 [Syntrophomonas sp.]